MHDYYPESQLEQIFNLLYGTIGAIVLITFFSLVLGLIIMGCILL